MNNHISIKIVLASLILLSASTASHAQTGNPEKLSANSGEFEPTPSFRASEILEPEMISGDHFRVREEVGSDGYWDIYM